MNKAPKVSVLVPIYNVERYLRRCIDSILGQTLQEIEVLLLDDGSNDASPAICDEYAAKDPRVRVIHKPNSGYGATMNVGLREAAGDYIGIVESDDWVESDMYSNLWSVAEREKVQIVKASCFYYSVKGGDRASSLIPNNQAGRVVNPRIDSAVFYIHPSIWSAIYKRSFLADNGIFFTESPGASYQDVAFNFKVWAKANAVWFSPQCVYHYRCDNPSSSVHSSSKVFCVSDEWRSIEEFVSQFPEEEKSSRSLRACVKLDSYIWNRNRLSGEARAAFEKVIAAEFRNSVKEGLIRRAWVSHIRWWRLQLILSASSPLRHAWVMLCYGVSRLSRVLIKYRISGGHRVWFILCGLVKISTPLAADFLPSYAAKDA